MDTFMDWFMWVFGVGIVVLLAVLLYGSYQESKKPTFELKKDSWVCVQSHKETHLQPVGKVLVPITRVICDEYKRVL